MKPKNITSDPTKFLLGIEQMNEVVGSTLGPNGRNVIYEKSQDYPKVTKDGVTVAREMNSIDPEINMGMMAVREAAEKSVISSGDGTTTSVILTHALVTAGLSCIENKKSRAWVKKEIKTIVEKIVDELKSRSIMIGNDLDRVHQIAKISANGEENLAKIISGCFKEVGLDGAINVLRSRDEKTYAELVDGFQFDRGYMFPEFVNVEGHMQVQFTNPVIYIYREHIRQAREVDEIITWADSKKIPVVIICDNHERHVVETLINIKQRGVEVAILKTPGFGDDLRMISDDIATMVGATPVNFTMLRTLQDNWETVVGTCESIVITAEQTTIIGGGGLEKRIASRREGIKVEIKDAIDDYRKSVHAGRLAMMNNGLATIRVGGQSDVERMERLDRVEDALGATRAAIEEGYIIGSGKALVEIVRSLHKTPDNYLLFNAFEKPFHRILENGDFKLSENDMINIPSGQGYNENLEIVNLLDEGIIDPTKVTRCAVENAASVASIILTTSSIISLIPLNKKQTVNEFIGI